MCEHATEQEIVEAVLAPINAEGPTAIPARVLAILVRQELVGVRMSDIESKKYWLEFGNHLGPDFLDDFRAVALWCRYVDNFEVR